MGAMVFTGYDLNKDFFEVNPQYKTVKEFKGIGSQLLWAIAFYSHPDSIYWELPDQERAERAQDIYKDFDAAKQVKAIKALEDISLSPGQRYYKEAVEFIEKRRKFLMETEWTPKNAKILNDIAKSNEAILKDMQRAKEIMDEDKSSRTFGGERLSRRDRRRVNDSD